MKCGSCQGNHTTVEEVVACYRKEHDKPLPARSRQPRPSGVLTASPKQISYAESLLKYRPSVKTDKPVKEMDRHEVSVLITRLRSMPPENQRTSRYNGGGDRLDIEGGPPPDGRYTVVMPEGRRTIRFYTPRQGGFENQRLVQFLSGSDNDSDYTTIGQVVPGGVKLWAKFRHNPEGLVIRAVSYLLKSGKEEWASAGETYALESSNCYRCGRTLTVPTSIHRGLGPDCFGKVTV